MTYAETITLERLTEAVAAKQRAFEAAPDERARAELIAAETILLIAMRTAHLTRLAEI